MFACAERSVQLMTIHSIFESVSHVPIRLTAERLAHILMSRPELGDQLREIGRTLSDPLSIFEGTNGEKLACRYVTDGKYLVVVYREILDSDGFVITAYFTRRYPLRKCLLWQSLPQN